MGFGDDGDGGTAPRGLVHQYARVVGPVVTDNATTLEPFGIPGTGKSTSDLDRR